MLPFVIAHREVEPLAVFPVAATQATRDRIMRKQHHDTQELVGDGFELSAGTDRPAFIEFDRGRFGKCWSSCDDLRSASEDPHCEWR